VNMRLAVSFSGVHIHIFRTYGSKVMGESSLGHPCAAGEQLWAGTLFFFAILAFFIFYFFCVMKMGLAFWKNGYIALPIF
jgi:hypothetical protein